MEGANPIYSASLLLCYWLEVRLTWKMACVVVSRPGGEIFETLIVPAAQARPKVTPCSSSMGSTAQGVTCQMRRSHHNA